MKPGGVPVTARGDGGEGPGLPGRGAAVLAGGVAVMAVVAAGVGLAVGGGEGPVTVASIRGEPVVLLGRGLYRNDTLFTGAGFRGQDLVTLALGVPALLWAASLHARGSLRGGLALTAVLGFFLYVYASMALAAAFNPLYLVYVALFSASLFALVLAFGDVGVRLGHVWVGPEGHGLPRLGPGVLLLVSGVGTAVIWLGPLVGALAAGRPPPLLGTYTTLVTETLDLGVIVPTCLLAGVLVLRGRLLGYRLAFPLFGTIILLTPTIAAATWSQLRAGIVFSPAEIAGPIVAFAVLGLLSVWAAAAVLRRVPGGG